MIQDASVIHDVVVHIDSFDCCATFHCKYVCLAIPCKQIKTLQWLSYYVLEQLNPPSGRKRVRSKFLVVLSQQNVIGHVILHYYTCVSCV